jgi:hypothetical protein
MKWISVKENLPKIPEGLYGISVLVATFDRHYDECCPGHGYSVHEVIYGSTRKRDGALTGPYLNSDLENDFMSLEPGFYDDTDWIPTSDPVTHWMYMPAPPED